MGTSEFDVIDLYFKPGRSREDVIVGIGDDCAVLDVPTGKRLLTSTDTLIAGLHFPEHTSPEDIAAKTVAVNFSDLAAMGAEPTWVTLALTLPDVDHRWLKAFSSSFHRAIDEYNVQLIGGDTTKGNLSLTLQVMGFIDVGKCMLRANAKPGDLIFVSGYLGDAALGLAMQQKKIALPDEAATYCLDRLNRPTARVELGQAISDYSKCAIDISDGLFVDLTHIMDASQCGANIELNSIPLSAPVRKYLADITNQLELRELMTGDDYELCFTADESHSQTIYAIAEKYHIPITCIGIINSSKELTCTEGNGHAIDILHTGFDHFS